MNLCGLSMVVSALKKRSVLFAIIPKELVSFESASGVESEYPVNPIQSLGHLAVGLREEQNGREAGETICHSWENRVLMSFVTAFSHLHRVKTFPGHTDMGTRLLR